MPRWHGLDHALRKVINQYIPVVAGAILMCGTMLVDQSMAAMLGAGSVATLNYGGKVVTLILGIGSVSLSTAVFPHFSRMVAVYDWAGIRHTLKTYTYSDPACHNSADSHSCLFLGTPRAPLI